MPADEKMNILLVDDRAENLVALESVLADLGQNLVRASSGMEALRHLLEEDFAVILLDVQMPEMDGFETARLIRTRERSQHTPIIFLTAINKSETHVTRGYSVGAVDYVFKPFLPEVLKAKVAVFVELARKRKELQQEISHRTVAESRLDASNALLETIGRSLVDFISEADPSAALTYLLSRVLALTGSEYGFIGELTDEAGEGPYLRNYAVADLFSDEPLVRKARPEGAVRDLRNTRRLCLELQARGAPLVANDPESLPSSRTLPPGHPPLRNFLALPFHKGGDMLGVVGIANRMEGYDEELISYLQPFLTTCATIVEGYRNERRRRDAEGEVRSLNEALERRVAERTAELEASNRELEQEIAERRRVEDERSRLLEREQAARAAAEAAQQRLVFLGEASTILASSLDYQTTLEQVAHLVVPHIADFCMIDLVGDGGSVRRVATAHADPEKQDLMSVLQERYAPLVDSPQPAARVLQSGIPELTSEVSDEWLGSAARDPDHLAVLRALQPRSYMVVPLIARGNTIGVISLGSAESGRIYREEDLVLAEDLARRAAAAIDNARLFREVRDAARRKDEFLAMLAHELRNPLAAMTSADYVLSSIDAPDDRARRLRGVISRQTRHLTRLVDDLLDISRITRGKIDLRLEPVELAAVVQRAVETVAPLIESRGHELHVKLPTEAVTLEADPTRLEQVLSNLLNNAAKYTEPGGRIDVIVDLAEAPDRHAGHANGLAKRGPRQCEVAIRVRDTGVGIPPDLLPYVFDLFTQAERSLDRSLGGLGIGLALVRNLVRMHGGRVAVASEGPGKGSEFVVTLPVRSVESRKAVQAAPVAPRAEEGPERRSWKVLVVEDNPDAAETLVELIELWGHEVTTVSTGQAALSLIPTYEPEFVLLDIGLPGMDGYEVARRIRSLEGAPRPQSAVRTKSTRTRPAARNGQGRITLVALTGYGQDEDRARSREAGFDLHLTKPVEPDELHRILMASPLAATC